MFLYCTYVYTFIMVYKNHRQRQAERAVRLSAAVPIEPICCVDIISQRRCCCCLCCERAPFEYVPAQGFLVDHHWVTDKIDSLNDIYLAWYRHMLMVSLMLLLLVPPVGLVMLCMLRSVLLRNAITSLAQGCERINRESIARQKGLFFTIFQRRRRMILRITATPNIPLPQPVLNTVAPVYASEGASAHHLYATPVPQTAVHDPEHNQPPPYEAFVHNPPPAPAPEPISHVVKVPNREPEPEPECVPEKSNYAYKGSQV